MPRFSTFDLPEKDRLPIWREVFARNVVKVELEPLGDEPFYSTSQVNTLPQTTIRRSSASAAIVRRTAPLVADGDDNFILAIMRNGTMRAEQWGREVCLVGEGAYLWTNTLTGVAENPVAMDLMTLTLSSKLLRANLRDFDRALMKPIPALSQALRLLIGYADLIQAMPEPVSPELASINGSHVHDLVALALGATSDAAETARHGGLRAARLHAVKADVLANLLSPELTLDAVARRQGISPRYIRILFEGEQTTFTDFVREHRLLRAYKLLASPQLAGQSVGAIAFDCGFGDLSHFHAIFRTRFGATPGDVRAQALRPGSG